jgi:hypothetical protein
MNLFNFKCTRYGSPMAAIIKHCLHGEIRIYTLNFHNLMLTVISSEKFGIETSETCHNFPRFSNSEIFPLEYLVNVKKVKLSLCLTKHHYN